MSQSVEEVGPEDALLTGGEQRVPQATKSDDRTSVKRANKELLVTRAPFRPSTHESQENDVCSAAGPRISQVE